MGRVDAERVFAAGERDGPCPGTQRGRRAEARGAGLQRCAGDNEAMATGVFVGVKGELWERPEVGGVFVGFWRNLL